VSAPVVYIIDDDPSYLRAVSRLLRATGLPVVIHTSAMEFLAELKPEAAGCVLTDLQMPDMDGMALQAALHQAGSLLPIVFLTGQGDIPTSVQAMRRGAEDFLTKHAPKDVLIAAVKRALLRNEQARAEQERQRALRARFALLTDREMEVLQHVLAGELNKQIADHLAIHERTVKLHRTSLTTKLNVHSVAELARLVQAAGLFPHLWQAGAPNGPAPAPDFPKGQ
jgi:two-component system, LuxR family, response regulator FixJ